MLVNRHLGNCKCAKYMRSSAPWYCTTIEIEPDSDQNHGLGDRVTVVSAPEVMDEVSDFGEPPPAYMKTSVRSTDSRLPVRPEQERVMHLVQDDETISEVHHCLIPPDEYYEELGKLWKKWWPQADVKVLEHMMSVLIAFDTATAFAMSFGIAKFSLCQIEAKLVGEIVGKYGRKPNPAIVRAIKNWPPIYTLKQLQEFLGTVNYVRPHCGPEYSRVAAPLRPLLRKDAVFPPNEQQNQSIEGLKDLVQEQHHLS